MLLPDLLTTDRLLLRPHVMKDFEGFYRVITDKEAMRFIHLSEEDRSKQQLLTFFSEVVGTLGSAQPVFGLAILEKGSRKYIGFCGLSELPDGTGTETYFVIHSELWGQGHATEAAQKLLEYAFSVLKLPHVDTFLVPENTASHLVASKLGMKDLGLTHHHEYTIPVSRFRVTREDFWKE